MDKQNWNEATIEEVTRYCIENKAGIVIEDGKITDVTEENT